MDTNLKQLDDELNAMILSGRAIEAMERFYAHDCAMQENTDAPTVGLLANLEREKQFFGMIEAFHGAKVLAQAIGDGVSMTEWTLDVTIKGQPRTVSHQVALRRWKDGKIVSERFYHK